MIRRRWLLGAGVGFAGHAWAQNAIHRPLPSEYGAGLLYEQDTVELEAPCGPMVGMQLTVNGRMACTSFSGIPYALDPVGPLRYASPRPVPRWAETLNAVAGAPGSIQTLSGGAQWLFGDPSPVGEECLTLRVVTPDPKGRRPVMVWLHGGAWRAGRGDDTSTEGTELAASGNVVVVAVNYRLGALGWLAHPALADRDTGAAANWGLQDQVLALRWVQANIAAFGGDPGNVTLFGQSAGGSSVASIVGDPRHAGLVHRAIIQSGSLHGAPAFPEMGTAAAYTEQVARSLDVDVPGLRGVPPMVLHEAELKLAALPQSAPRLGRAPALPVLDGVVLKTWPRDVTLAPVPLLIGTNTEEAVFWFDLVGPDGQKVQGLRPPETMDELRSMVVDLAAIYRPEAADKAAAMASVYAGAADPLAAWIAAYTDVVFRLRAREAAVRHAQAGHATFLYEFAHPLASPAHGVPHTAEIPFVFATFWDQWFAARVGDGAAEQALSTEMLGAWTRFAHDGNPGWPQVDPAGLVSHELGGPVSRAVPGGW